MQKMIFLELFPKIFHGLDCGSFAVECLKISVQIVGGDGTICGVKVYDKGQSGNVVKTEKMLLSSSMKTHGMAEMSCLSKFASMKEYFLSSARDAANWRLVSVIWSPATAAIWKGVAPG